MIGIDDYMVKPVDLDEMILHISALLRRSGIVEGNRLVIGKLILDADAVTVTTDGVPVSLTLREFRILFKLLSCPNKVFTRSQLINEFRGIAGKSGLRTVDVFIAKLRARFSQCREFQILTIRGIGYKAVLL